MRPDQMISCREVVERVSDYLDGGLDMPSRRAFERHVASCPPCRGHLAQLRAVRRTSGELGCDDLPGDVAERLREAFEGWAAGRREPL